MDTNQLKIDLLERLQKDHPELCRRWFGDIKILGVIQGSVKIQVDEPVQLKYLQRCCTQQFSDAAQTVTGRLLTVTFVGNEEVATLDGETVFGDSVSGAGSLSGRGSSVIEDDMFISPDYTFGGLLLVQETVLHTLPRLLFLIIQDTCTTPCLFTGVLGSEKHTFCNQFAKRRWVQTRRCESIMFHAMVL